MSVWFVRLYNVALICNSSRPRRPVVDHVDRVLQAQLLITYLDLAPTCPPQHRTRRSMRAAPQSQEVERLPKVWFAHLGPLMSKPRQFHAQEIREEALACRRRMATQCFFCHLMISISFTIVVLVHVCSTE